MLKDHGEVHNDSQKLQKLIIGICSNASAAIFEELMLSIYGYEWLGEVEMRNRNGTQLFRNLQTHYDGPG